MNNLVNDCRSFRGAFIAVPEPRYIHAARCSDKEDDMDKCDWADCVKVGLFDGVENTLLNAEGQKNVGKDFRRFLYLCPEHFKLAIGTPDKENPPPRSA
jgi:hypothetical protein